MVRWSVMSWDGGLFLFEGLDVSEIFLSRKMDDRFECNDKGLSSGWQLETS